MSDVYLAEATYDVRKAVVPERTSEVSRGRPWAARDGALIDIDWRQSLAMDGRVFCFNLGNVTTSVAGCAADVDQPQVAIRNGVNSGVAMIPLEAHIYCEDTVGATAELIVSCASIDIGAGTSTAGVVQNMKAGAGGSNVSVSYTYSGNGTAAVWGTNYWELQRTGAMYNIADDDTLEPELHYTPLVSPVLMPGSTFFMFWGGTASATAYATAIWAEVPLSTVEN